MKILAIVFLMSLPLLAQVEFKTVSADSGVALSDAFWLGTAQMVKRSVVGVEIPPGFTGDSLSFRAKNIGSSYWYDVFNEGVELAFPASDSIFILIDSDKLVNMDSLQIRSGTRTAPDTLTADIDYRVKLIELK